MVGWTSMAKCKASKGSAVKGLIVHFQIFKALSFILPLVAMLRAILAIAILSVRLSVHHMPGRYCVKTNELRIMPSSLTPYSLWRYKVRQRIRKG